jgi:hypothetical protein
VRRPLAWWRSLPKSAHLNALGFVLAMLTTSQLHEVVAGGGWVRTSLLWISAALLGHTIALTGVAFAEEARKRHLAALLDTPEMRECVDKAIADASALLYALHGVEPPKPGPSA